MADQANEHGPSWWDVEQLHDEMERRWDRQIVLQAFCSHDRESGRASWQVVATSHPRGRPSNVDVRGGSYAFRGRSGAKTMPAAMLLALHRLEDALTEKKTASEQRSLF
jgi:hypothetical protein